MKLRKIGRVIIAAFVATCIFLQVLLVPAFANNQQNLFLGDYNVQINDVNPELDLSSIEKNRSSTEKEIESQPQDLEQKIVEIKNQLKFLKELESKGMVKTENVESPLLEGQNDTKSRKDLQDLLNNYKENVGILATNTNVSNTFVSLKYNNVYYERVLKPGNDLDVTFQIYNEGADLQSYVPMIIMYENGKVISIKTDNLSLEGDQSDTLTLTMPIPEDIENKTVKINLWDSFTSMNSLMTPIEVTGTPQDYYGNELSTAILIDTESDVVGSIDVIEDVDFFKFIPETDGVYTVETTGDMDTVGVIYNSIGNKWCHNDNIDSNNLNFRMVQRFTANEEYYLKITGNETGAYNLRISYTPEQPIIDNNPSVPAGLSVKRVTADEIELNWNPSYDNIGIDSYELHTKFLDGSSQINYTNDTTYLVTGLQPNTQYSFIIKSKNAYGNMSEESLPLDVLTNNGSIEEDSGSNLETAQELSPDIESIGVINYVGNEDIFKFTPDTDGVYVITSGGDLNTYGILFDSQYLNNVVSYSDSISDEDTNFKIVANLIGGHTYYIKIGKYENNINNIESTNLYNLAAPFNTTSSNGEFSVLAEPISNYLTRNNVNMGGFENTAVRESTKQWYGNIYHDLGVNIFQPGTVVKMELGISYMNFAYEYFADPVFSRGESEGVSFLLQLYDIDSPSLPLYASIDISSDLGKKSGVNEIKYLWNDNGDPNDYNNYWYNLEKSYVAKNQAPFLATYEFTIPSDCGPADAAALLLSHNNKPYLHKNNENCYVWLYGYRLYADDVLIVEEDFGPNPSIDPPPITDETDSKRIKFTLEPYKRYSDYLGSPGEFDNIEYWDSDEDYPDESYTSANTTTSGEIFKNSNLGVVASFVENGLGAVNIISSLLLSVFGSSSIITQNYMQIEGGKEETIRYLESWVTNEAAYYSGRTLTDIILIEVGVVGSISSIGLLVSGLSGSAISAVGEGLTLGTGSLVFIPTAAISTAVAAAGVVGTSTCLSLTATAGSNLPNNFLKLRNAITKGNTEVTIDDICNIDDLELNKMITAEDGHMIDRHVAKDDQFLINRTNGSGKPSTSFEDYDVAMDIANELLKKYAPEISNWVNKPRSPVELFINITPTSVTDVGYGIRSRNGIIETGLTKARFMLIKDSNQILKFRIHTGYPIF